MRDQSIQAGQKLTEMWGISFEKQRYDSPIVARLDSWPHTTYYLSRGQGKTVVEARLNLVTMLAKAIHEDPNPFGDLGKVLHAADMLSFLHSLKTPADYYNLLDNTMEGDLPEGWEKVIDHVITMFQGYMDYWPEEETVSSADAKAIAPPSGDDVA